MYSSPMSLCTVTPKLLDAIGRATTLTPSAGTGRSASELTGIMSIPGPWLELL